MKKSQRESPQAVKTESDKNVDCMIIDVVPSVAKPSNKPTFSTKMFNFGQKFGKQCPDEDCLIILDDIDSQKCDENFHNANPASKTLPKNNPKIIEANENDARCQQPTSSRYLINETDEQNSNTVPTNDFNFTRQEPKSNLKFIIIDGSNVAREHGKLMGNVFSCKGIQIVVEYFKSRGHKDIKAMVPRFRRGESDKICPTVNPEILDELEKNGYLTYTPSRFVNQKLILPYDDRFILKAALHFNAIIVSNDNYRDLMKENLDWKRLIETNLLQFSFIGDLFMIADDPLGRYGPKLDQFLSVEFNAQNQPTTNFQNVPNNFYKEPNNFTNNANNNKNINNIINNNSDKFKRQLHKKGFKKNNKKPGGKNFGYNKNRVNKLTKKKTTRFNATMKNLMKSTAAQNTPHRNFKNNNKNASFTRKYNNNTNNIKNEPKSSTK